MKQEINAVERNETFELVKHQYLVMQLELNGFIG